MHTKEGKVAQICVKSFSPSRQLQNTHLQNLQFFWACIHHWCWMAWPRHEQISGIYWIKSTRIANYVVSLSSLSWFEVLKLSWNISVNVKMSLNCLCQDYSIVSIALLEQCTMCTLCSMFSFQPNKLRHILKCVSWYIIQHIFVPTCSVGRKTWFLRKPWFSNSKFGISGSFWPILTAPKIMLLVPKNEKQYKF